MQQEFAVGESHEMHGDMRLHNDNRQGSKSRQLQPTEAKVLHRGRQIHSADSLFPRKSPCEARVRPYLNIVIAEGDQDG
jgi:hypothetical protein